MWIEFEQKIEEKGVYFLTMCLYSQRIKKSKFWVDDTRRRKNENDLLQCKVERKIFEEKRGEEKESKNVAKSFSES